MDTIEIIFGPSSSKSFKRALELAKKCSSYSEKDGEHRISWDPKDTDSIIPLYRLISSWKGTRVIINGKQVIQPRVLTSWTYCYDQVSQDPNRGSCFSLRYSNIPLFPFGCKSGRDLNFWKYSQWLRLGELKGTEWIFDKPAIYRFVAYKTRDFRLCPNQRQEWVDAFLDVFPASIDPSKDMLWCYQTKEGSERIFTLMIQLGGNKEGQDPEKKEEIIGVGPKDGTAADEILEQLFTMVHLKHNLTGG